MSTNPARLLELLDSSEIGTFSYRHCGYSAPCVSVRVSRRNGLLGFAADFVGDMVGASEDESGDYAVMNAALRLLKTAKHDSLGLDTVVYWPSIPWPEGRKDSEDEEGDE